MSQQLFNTLTFTTSFSTQRVSASNTVTFSSTFSTGPDTARMPKNTVQFRSTFAGDSGILAGGLNRERQDNAQ